MNILDAAIEIGWWHAYRGYIENEKDFSTWDEMILTFTIVVKLRPGHALADEMSVHLDHLRMHGCSLPGGAVQVASPWLGHTNGR